MDLSRVHQGVHKKKKKRRVGRGIGSGHGKTAGRGHKGQFTSAGAEKPHPLFEGGQMPLFRRMPKRGFTRGRFAKNYLIVNVGDLDKIFADGDTVDPVVLRNKGLANGPSDGVRILGSGELSKKLVVKAHHFSKSAKEKIETKGGTVELIPPPKKPVKNKMKSRGPQPAPTPSDESEEKET